MAARRNLTKVRIAADKARFALEGRNEEIRAAHAAGETLQAVADAAGLSKQRAHQIVHAPRLS